MKRKIHSVRQVNEQEADIINQTFEELYRYKPEEVVHRTSASALALKTYRENQTGIHYQASQAATTSTITIALNKKYNEILGVQITPVGTAVSYFVTDVTQSQITVKAVSADVNLPLKFYYRVTGSLE